jgi:hypothetical protein
MKADVLRAPNTKTAGVVSGYSESGKNNRVVKKWRNQSKPQTGYKEGLRRARAAYFSPENGASSSSE